MSDKFVKLVSTFFYIGNIPPAPGTLASAATVLVCFLLHKSLILYVLAFIIFTRLGFMVSARMEKIVGKKDPGCVVIDEVSGVMISYFMLPFNWPVVFTTFFLFRAFDMFKIYPANIMEERGGSFGIMMDDIVAGIYTNIVMQVAIRLAGII